MVSMTDLPLQDGRTLRVYDSADAHGRPEGSGDRGATGFTVLWHHGSPQTGALLDPLLTAAAERGIRILSYGRPSYGGSSPHPGRDVASAASDVAQIADAFGIDRLAVMGASGGGPHALACAALLPGLVTGVACLATLAPFEAVGFDWFAGMAGGGPSLRAAAAGRGARELHEATSEFDPEMFTERDYAVLDGSWASLSADVGVASAAGSEGLIDDDLAYVAPWGFAVARIGVPVLLVHGSEDRVVPPAHSEWLLHALPDTELWVRPRDGHVSVLEACPVALDWLCAHASPTGK